MPVWWWWFWLFCHRTTEESCPWLLSNIVSGVQWPTEFTWPVRKLYIHGMAMGGNSRLLYHCPPSLTYWADSVNPQLWSNTLKILNSLRSDHKLYPILLIPVLTHFPVAVFLLPFSPNFIEEKKIHITTHVHVLPSLHCFYIPKLCFNDPSCFSSS